MTNPISAPTGAPAPTGDRARLHQVSQQFEALFLRQVLSAAHSADLGGNDLYGDNPLSGGGEETFTQMRDERFADIASNTGALGLAKQIEAQLAKYVRQEG